jgi:hypothetical protein
MSNLPPPQGEPIAPPSSTPLPPPQGEPLAAPSSTPLPPPFAPAPDDVFSSPEQSLAEFGPEGFEEEPGSTSKRRRPRVTRSPRVKTEKAPRTLRGERSSRAERSSARSTDDNAVVVVVPVLTAFDLLEGGYQKVIRSRIGIMVVAGLFVLAALLLGSLGLTTRLHTSSVATQLQTANTATNTYQSELGKITNYTAPNGTVYSGTKMQGDIDYRAPLVRLAVGASPDVLRILSDISTLSGTGITVSSIQIAPAAAAAAATTTTTVTTLPGSPATTTPTTPTPTGTPIVISVTATSSSALVSFVDELNTLKYLTDISPVSSGSGSSLTATITATVTNLPYPIPSAAQTSSTTTGAANG